MEDGIHKYSDGTREYWLNNQLHRTDGPAIELLNGTKEWFINGKLHRSQGPSVIYPNGDQEWYINGKLHREDGPAVTYICGIQFWYLNGIYLGDNIEKWIEENDLIIPFDKESQTLFLMTWG